MKTFNVDSSFRVFIKQIGDIKIIYYIYHWIFLKIFHLIYFLILENAYCLFLNIYSVVLFFKNKNTFYNGNIDILSRYYKYNERDIKIVLIFFVIGRILLNNFISFILFFFKLCKKYYHLSCWADYRDYFLLPNK